MQVVVIAGHPHPRVVLADSRVQHDLVVALLGDGELALHHHIAVVDFRQQRRARPAPRPVAPHEPGRQIRVHDAVLGLQRLQRQAQQGVFAVTCTS
ncbi:hypothetical protein [Amycolatopsis sp. cmx-4-68]|uniref:hypothetical protein n=1 Tax=Amycolatopsis sp. cmx-4-68 TaxID=2790938 RepID=UPI00397D99F7